MNTVFDTMKEIFKAVPENNLEWQGYNRLLESNIIATEV